MADLTDAENRLSTDRLRDDRLRVLLLEPWLGGSHGQWAEGYAAASSHQVTVIGLPADRWRWRLRAGAAPLADAVARHVRTHGRPDAVVVSSPLDTARLLGLARSTLAGVPVAVYQHESQLLYPRSGRPERRDDDALADWFSWLAADTVWFNSSWHRQAVVDALPSFVARFPDRDHDHRLDAIMAKFAVLPPGLDLGWTATAPVTRSRDRSVDDLSPIIVWPHRWEPDKDPAAFAAAVDRLAAAGLRFRLVLAGASGPVGDPRGNLPAQLVTNHGARVLARGPFNRSEYRAWLVRADIVVSCAHHDFFGVAVAEAVAAGCVPVVPDALNYPDLLGPAGRPFLYDPGRFGTRLAEVVASWPELRTGVTPLVSAMARFDWAQLAPTYDAHIRALVHAADTNHGRRGAG